MVKFLIVDDDTDSIDRISELIEKYMHEEFIIDSFTSSTAFICKIKELNADVVFMDIDMPEISGFEVSETLKKVTPSIQVFFVSNWEHLVFDSFMYGASQFIRKSRLHDDMKKVLIYFQEKLTKKRKVFRFYTSEREYTVSQNSIIFFECSGHDIFIHIDSNEVHRLKRNDNLSMKKLENQLRQEGFLLVNRYALVNFQFIYAIHRDHIALKNGETISFNPRKLNQLKKDYQSFLMMEA